MLKCFKKKSDAESAECLMALLWTMRDKVTQLPTSTRETSCTFARFYLLLLPLVNIAEQGDYAKTKALTTNFFDLLLESSYALSIKVSR